MTPVTKAVLLSAVASLLASCTQPAHTESPEELYESGVKLKRAGRIAESKQKLAQAIASDKSDKVITAKAQHFLETQLPKGEVPLDAEQRNVIGYNQLGNKDYAQARRTFEQLIADYPEFEWPYNNLALLEVQEHHPERAEKLLEQAIKINNDYGNAWMTLLKIKDASGDSKGAMRCFEQIKRLEAKN